MHSAVVSHTLDTRLVGIAIFVYLLATVLYFVYLPFKKQGVGIGASLVALVGWGLVTASMVARAVISYRMGWGHAPFANLYESMVFFAWAIVLIYLIIEWRYKNRTMGAFVMPFAFVALAYTTIGPGIRTQIEPLIPALQSDWLIAHVITCFLGYAAFAVSCGVSVMYLIKARARDKGKDIAFLPDLRALDEINYKSVGVGFPLLTLGIITGAVWANYAWGSYWSWDPKETWSLITWLIYAAFLHARFARGWRGKETAILSIIGFVAVLFTYLGVNLLIVGLHSYA